MSLENCYWTVVKLIYLEKNLYLFGWCVDLIHVVQIQFYYCRTDEQGPLSFVPLRSFLCKPLISQRILNGFNMPWLEEAGKISKLILSNFQPFMIWSIIKGMNELMKETLKINFGILLLFIKSQHVKGRLTYEQC